MRAGRGPAAGAATDGGRLRRNASECWRRAGHRRDPVSASQQATAAVDRTPMQPALMSVGPATVHVVGAGLAGLSAAVALDGRGVRVVLSEAARQAGGRCRSYHDAPARDEDRQRQPPRPVRQSSVAAISARSARRTAHRARHAAFPFFDSQRAAMDAAPNEGASRGGSLMQTGACRARSSDYLALASLLRRHPGRRIDEVLPCRGVLWERFLRPVLLSVFNTAPEEASARSRRRDRARDLRQGRPHIRPHVATPSLAAAFVDPALASARADRARTSASVAG